MDFYITYWLLGIILLPGIILAAIAQAKVSSNYNKSKQISLQSNKTGQEIAREILDNNNLQDITLAPIDGDLTDHYNPKTKHINLSNDIYHGNSIASAAIAAHEVGHVLQEQDGNISTKIRAFLVPIINFSSKLLWPMIIIGILFNAFGSTDSLFGTVCIYVGLVFFGGSILFSLFTLPTELDASSRAMKALIAMNIIRDEEIPIAKKMLTAAAWTYIAALLVAILNFVRFILTILILKNND